MKTTQNSVAEMLGRAHRALLEDLRKLEEATPLADGGRREELYDLLAETRVRVAEHFRLEEQNGYLDAVSKREPRLGRAIAELAPEHGRLLQAADGLVERARARGGADESFGDEVRKWVEAVRRHEGRENDLVQDAFNLDIGAED